MLSNNMKSLCYLPRAGEARCGFVILKKQKNGKSSLPNKNWGLFSSTENGPEALIQLGDVDGLL